MRVRRAARCSDMGKRAVSSGAGHKEGKNKKESGELRDRNKVANSHRELMHKVVSREKGRQGGQHKAFHLPTLRSPRPHRGTSNRMAAPTQSPRWPGENSSVAVPRRPKSAATRWRPQRQARVACAPLRSSARCLVSDKARVDSAHFSRFVAAKGVSLPHSL